MKFPCQLQFNFSLSYGQNVQCPQPWGLTINYCNQSRAIIIAYTGTLRLTTQKEVPITCNWGFYLMTMTFRKCNML